MVVLLFIGFLLTLLMGVGVFATAKSAIHEIEGCILLLVAAGFFSGLGIINAIEKLQIEVEKRWPESPE